MSRQQNVFEIVKDLYENTQTEMGLWMWNNHVQWVATRAKELAQKYRADDEKVFCAALLHDLGDAEYPRRHKDFKSWSDAKGNEILAEVGFSDLERKEIIEVIIHPHSCRPGNLPSTLEGKILSTADAMFHLQTNFFPLFCHMNRPEIYSQYSEWQAWISEKLPRDFNVKIFFEEEREVVREDYIALMKVFENKSLSD